MDGLQNYMPYISYLIQSHTIQGNVVRWNKTKHFSSSENPEGGTLFQVMSVFLKCPKSTDSRPAELQMLSCSSLEKKPLNNTMPWFPTLTGHVVQSLEGRECSFPLRGVQDDGFWNFPWTHTRCICICFFLLTCKRWSTRFCFSCNPASQNIRWISPFVKK